MSIFKQIFILMFLSCCILLFITYKNENFFKEQLEITHLNQMLYSLTPLYDFFSKGNIIKVKDLLSDQGYRIKIGAQIPQGAKILYEKHGLFDHIIVWTRDMEYGILFRYLDDILLASKNDPYLLSEIQTLHILILFQILLIIIIYILIYLILHPIKQISLNLKRFKNGDYNTRLYIKQKNELGHLACNFNMMADQISHLLKSKELLLRNAGHELRTPIAKGKLALELMQENMQKPFLKECFNRLDSITNSLLTLEYLQSTPALKHTNFYAQTLLLEALSQSLAQEENITIDIKQDFQITGDLSWLSTALKNLIDNAIKYSENNAPIHIILDSQKISVCNKGKPLKGDFDLYLNAFTRGNNTHIQGYGLGLSIVKSILDIHQCTLTHDYMNEQHIISILFPNNIFNG